MLAKVSTDLLSHLVMSVLLGSFLLGFCLVSSTIPIPREPETPPEYFQFIGIKYRL